MEKRKKLQIQRQANGVSLHPGSRGREDKIQQKGQVQGEAQAQAETETKEKEEVVEDQWKNLPFGAIYRHIPRYYIHVVYIPYTHLCITMPCLLGFE